MKLSQDIKDKIYAEYNSWLEKQYAGKTKAERQEFGQFFTPPSLTIKMIEEFDNLDGSILDPTVGCGRFISSMYYSWG